MKKKPTLKQKIIKIRKLNCLLSILSSIAILSTITLFALAFVFKQYLGVLFISGSICAIVSVIVNHFQTIMFHEENVLYINQFEKDYYTEK